MKGIISTNKIELETINKKINNYMKANIENYAGTSWGKIIFDNENNEYFLEINEDSRNPRSILTLTEKNSIKEKDTDIIKLRK